MNKLNPVRVFSHRVAFMLATSVLLLLPFPSPIVADDSPGKIITWEPGTNFHRLDMSVETPHWPWGRPWADKPLRVLAVGGRHLLREAVELYQRLDCVVDIIPGEGLDEWTIHTRNRRNIIRGVIGCMDIDTVISRHLETLKNPCDVIVFGASTLNWSSMPEPLQTALLDKVRNGTGLLITSPRNFALPPFVKDIDLKPALTQGTDIRKVRGARFSGRDDLADLRTGHLGKGLVTVLINPDGVRNLLTSGALTRPDYEYSFQVSMRALLLTAGRSPLSTWKRLDIEADTIIGELSSLAAGIELHLFDLWEREVASEVWRNTTEFQYNRPQLPAGRYFARLRVLDSNGHVLDWGALVFDRLEKQQIVSVVARQDLRYPGKSAQWDVTLSKEKADSVTARIYDSSSRVLGEYSFQVEGGKTVVDIPIPATHGIYHQLELDVIANKRVTDRNRYEFGVQQPVDCRDINVGFWGFRGRDAYPERWRQLHYRRIGIDMAMFNLRPYYEMRIMDYAGHLPRIVWKPPEEAPPFPGDPEFRQRVAIAMRERLEQTREWSPAVLNLGDEPSYRYVDRSPIAMDAFRQWLRERHGDGDAGLKSLNRQWQTDYSGWGKVERVETWQAQRSNVIGLAAGWASEMFNRKITADFYLWQQQQADILLPGLRAGPEGIWAKPEYFSIDYIRTLRGCGFVGCYGWDKDTMSAVRSFGRADQIAGAWFGSYDFSDPDWIRATPWQIIFEGLNAPMWFEGGRQETHPLLMPLTNPGWDLHLASAPAFEEIAHLRRGLARLLLGAKRLDTGIRVVRPALIPSTSHATWLRYLEALGHQAELILGEDIISGRGMDGAKILILSEVQAVDDDVAKSLASWIEQGGILIADRRIGMYDSSGAPRQAGWVAGAGALDGLFGIQWREAHEWWQGKKSPSRSIVSLEWDGSRFDVLPGGVPKADNALAKLMPGDIPAIFYRSVGRGKVVYLNFGLPEKTHDPGGHTLLVKALLRYLNVQPVLHIDTDQPHTAGLQLIRYKREGIEILALHRQRYRGWELAIGEDEEEIGDWSRDAWKVAVPIAKHPHVYDAYKGEYLGRLDKWSGPLEYGRPVLLACLPGRVVMKNMTTVKTVTQGSRVKLLFGVDMDGLPYEGVVNISFYRPNGEVEPLFSRNHDLIENQAAVPWDVALNEVPGSWTIKCRDAATGCEAAHHINITPRVIK